MSEDVLLILVQEDEVAGFVKEERDSEVVSIDWL
jgi:hypothetical protein